MVHRRGHKRSRRDSAALSGDEELLDSANKSSVAEDHSVSWETDDGWETPGSSTTPMHCSTKQHFSGTSQQSQGHSSSKNSSTPSKSESFILPVVPKVSKKVRFKEATNKPTVQRRGRRGRGKGRVREAEQLRNLEEDSSLYDEILNDRLSPDEIADRWIQKYKNDKDNAMLMLKQFFISSSGCNGRITPEMQGMNDADIIAGMTEQFDADDLEYPMIIPGQKSENFRKRFGEFVQSLVFQCRNSIIYDQVVLVEMRLLLIVLSLSKVRDFRHTGTMAAMKLMTALVKVAKEVCESLKITKRQLETENKKTKGNKSLDKLETLTAKLTEFEENFTELKCNLDSLFTAVFVYRYIDIVPDIRIINIIEMGIWMQIFPNYFINDRYLKYVGWTLCDKAAKVRIESVRALQPLYASEDNKSKLEGFTGIFKDRIVAMVLDKDFEVATEAVKLVTSLLKYHRTFFTDTDCECIFEVVYSSNRGVAEAAGLFLKERLFTPDDNDSVCVKSGRGKPRLPNTPMIRDLVLFFIEADLHEHASYLVDSLIDSNPMIKDWECMTDLLIEDAGPQEEPLSNQTETCLIELMVSSVKLAATGEGPVGRTPVRKINSKKEQKQLHDDKQRLTEHFITTLPLLLKKYQADPDKLTNLLVIPRYFDLTVYTTLREEESLHSLLSNINDIVTIMLDVEVLKVAAKTMEFMCADNSPIFRQCDVARSILIDSLVDKYKEAILKYRYLIKSAESPGEDEIFDVIESLKKVSIFYCSHDMNSWNIQDSLVQDIVDAKDPTGGFPVEAAVYSINAYFFSILWSQNNLMYPEEVSRIRLEDEARRLREYLDNFMDLMKYFVDSGLPDAPTPPEIRGKAFNTICDLLVMFPDQLANDTNPLLRSLAYKVDEHMRSILNRFIQERVFIERKDDERDEQPDVEELHKRRNFLAGYCKLIVYNILATKWAADVFKHYVKYYNDYGDIIKATLSRARGINKVNWALTIQHSLKILYLDIVAEKGEVQRKSKVFAAIKELARKFALLFGFQAAQNRDSVTALHSAGILFATENLDSLERGASDPSPNLLYLEVLAEFTGKLLKQDRRVVLEFLNSKVQKKVLSPSDEKWNPLIVYRKSLLGGGSGETPAIVRDPDEDDVAEDNRVDGAGQQSVRKTTNKQTKKRATKKKPLPVIKITHAGCSSTPFLHENINLTPDSPLPSIEYSSQDSSPSIEDDIASLGIHSA